MTNTRVIPCLLLKNRGLYKTTKFSNPVYVGDPFNTVKIFNEKEVHEIAIIDITASVEGRKPDFEFLQDIASECFMPLSYGGGITTLEDAKKLFSGGFEKVIINTALFKNIQLIGQIAAVYGSQAVVASIDVKKNIFGKYQVLTKSGKEKTGYSPREWAQQVEQAGAGEILLTSIDKEGTMEGYDTKLIAEVANAVSIPVIANGGAKTPADFGKAVQEGNASAVAAGCMFVFQGPHRAVLISFPKDEDLKAVIA